MNNPLGGSGYQWWYGEEDYHDYKRLSISRSWDSEMRETRHQAAPAEEEGLGLGLEEVEEEEDSSET